jgi:hypothetical protein
MYSASENKENKMKPQIKFVLSFETRCFIESVVHQLTTDSDLDGVSAPEKYIALANRGKAILDWFHDAGEDANLIDKERSETDSHADLTAEQIREAAAANSGCIDGMCCPKCGHYEAFEIYVTQSAMTYVHDDGTDFDGGDTEWDADSDCRCPECDHLATVADFQLSDVALARADTITETK